jgi:hypothetical protein
MPKLAELVDRLKRETPGWSLLHSTLDFLTDRVLGLLVTGVTVLASFVATSLSWYRIAGIAVGATLVLVALMRWVEGLRKNSRPVESDPLKVRIDELIDRAGKTDDIESARGWMYAARELMYRCETVSRDGFLELDKELQDFVEDDHYHMGERRSPKEVVNAGVSIMKNFLASRSHGDPKQSIKQD